MVGNLGKFKLLEVVRESPHGFYLALDEDEVLLPNKYCEGLKLGDKVDVFLYKDSEDRPVATTEIPLLSIGEIKPLEVVELVPFGAFVDMGLEKHLLVPKMEMLTDMRVGEKYLVRLMVDFKTERLIGVAKLEAFSVVPEDIELNQAMGGLVYQKTDLGYKIWTELGFIGLVYHSQVYEALHVGDAIPCYVDEIRMDGKIDLRLKEGGLITIDADAQKVLNFLKNNGGESSITDRAEPEQIRQVFGMSKKAFKKAVGTLYKQRLIKLEPGKISLVVK
jgi:predicted RNA-binding protein (virulence factor B family)